jgi:hypothetical protein
VDFSNSSNNDAIHTYLRILATAFDRGLLNSFALNKEGAGDPQERAQGRPGARCTRGLMCKNARSKNAHEHTGSAEAVRPSLRNGFTAYLVLSPARPGLFVTVISRKREPPKNLTPAIGASGPHDFAVRFSRARQSQLWRPSLPDPRFVTNAHTPLWWDGMAQEVKLICLRDQARSLRHIGTTGNSAKCCQDLFDGALCFSFSPRGRRWLE